MTKMRIQGKAEISELISALFTITDTEMSQSTVIGARKGPIYVANASRSEMRIERIPLCLMTFYRNQPRIEAVKHC
jgi:hypothetical protein